MDEPLLSNSKSKYISNNLYAIINILNLLIGIGCLSLPYAFSQGGWISIIFLFIIVLITNHTAKIIAEFTTIYNTKNYQEIAEIVFGKKIGIFIKYLVCFELYLVSVSYLIIIGDNLEKLFPNINNKLLVLSGFLVTLPTICIRKINILSYFSIIGVITYIILLVNIIYTGIINDLFKNPNTTLVTNIKDTTNIFGLFIICFGGHAVLPSIFINISNSNKLKNIIDIPYYISVTFYLIYGFCGYLMFGNQVKPEITLNLDDNDLFTKITIGLVIINPIVTTSLILYPVLETIEADLYKSYSIRVFVYTLALGISYIIPNFTFILTLFGCIATYFISIIFPLLVYIKIYKDSISKNRYSTYIFIIIISIIFSIIGLISIIINT